MKALILAAGRGKRLGSISEAINKCMIKFANKPLIEYSLDCIAKLSQIEEIVIVVGYRAEDIMNTYKDNYKGKKIVYVKQEFQDGLVNAIECAKEAIGNSDFMLMLGDEFMFNPNHQKFIETFEKENVFVLCGVVMVKDRELIKKTYSILQAEDGRILRLIEKPNNPLNNIMGTGNCLFRNAIFNYIPYTPINQKRKEKELPDLIQCVVDDGFIVKPFIICSDYINVNSPEELNQMNSYFSHL